MAIFLFFLILIFIVLPLALLSRLFGGLFSLFRRASNVGSSFSRSGYRQSSQANRANRRKKKIFDRTDGEYVEFEEIIENDSASSQSPHQEVHYDVEEQVSDAEWTDIK